MRRNYVLSAVKGVLGTVTTMEILTCLGYGFTVLSHLSGDFGQLGCQAGGESAVADLGAEGPVDSLPRLTSCMAHGALSALLVMPVRISA